jgi:hypothetical protein
MQHHTRPIPHPKPAVPSRDAALEEETLIELDARVAGTVLPMPAALTEALLDLVEQLPFRAPPSAVPATRMAGLLRGAAAALQRAREHYGAHFGGALMHGFIIDFCAELPRRSTEPRYPFVRLHCGPDEHSEIVATLGLPAEI